MEGNVNDSSANGYHASAAGTPVYTAGQIGQAIDLDGTDDAVTLPSGVADSSDITVAAWVHWDGGGQWERIFDFGNNTTQNMFLTPLSGSNTLRFAITTSGGGGEQRIETSQLATGTWVHVAVTLNGNTGKLYVNGSPAATNNAMTNDPSDFNPAINYIGKSQYADPLFDGRIDDFRIYNFALVDAAIAQLARPQTDMGDLSMLAAWWLWLTQNCSQEPDCLAMDINGDGVINLADFAELAGRWL
jgi:hypothetical protein